MMCFMYVCVQGNGTYVWANGDRYAGEWRKGKMHGKGKKTMKTGDVYDGVCMCVCVCVCVYM